MRPEPQPSCWPSASSSRACFASDPWPYVPPYGFAGSIFRRATMARVTRIATQSALRSDAITILLACDRPQTDKGIRRGGRRGARLGHSGTAVCGRKGCRGRRIHDREPHCPGNQWAGYAMAMAISSPFSSYAAAGLCGLDLSSEIQRLPCLRWCSWARLAALPNARQGTQD